MTGDRLSQEQRDLVARASRVDASVMDNAMLLEGVERAAKEGTHLILTRCSNCREDVHVVPAYRKIALCAQCLADGHRHQGEPEREERAEIPRSPHVPVRDWERGADKRLAVHPQPVRTSREPWPEGVGVPDAVLKLQRLAEGAGWGVELTYAKGTGQHATTGRPTSVVETIAVRMMRGGRRVVAVHTIGKGWDSMWAVKHMLNLRTVEQLKAYLAEPTDDLLIARIRRENREHAAQEARTAACNRHDVHDEHEWINTKRAAKWCRGRKTPKASSGAKRETGG